MDSYNNNIDVPHENKGDHDVIYALRTIHQNQTQLNTLADQKANILIGIITIIVSVLITRVDSIQVKNEYALATFYFFLLFQLMSVFTALFMLLPKNINRIKINRLSDASNPLFFGCFAQIAQKEFVNYLFNHLDNNQTARIVLLTDIYQMGIVLKKKFVLLRYAYLFAIVGTSFLLMAAILHLLPI